MSPTSAESPSSTSARRLAPWGSASAVGVLVIWILSILVALRGTWVYDDFYLLDHEPTWRMSDVVSVFSKTSEFYQASIGTGTADDVSGKTFRPVTMATLLVVHVLWPSPLAHHLVSAAMHLGVALGIFVAIRRWFATSSAVAATIACVFLLHPVNVESYVWINGRSDLVAGCFLAILAVFLGRAPTSIDSRRDLFIRALALSGLSFLGVSSKETFAFAAASVVAASWFVFRSTAGRRVLDAIALFVGIGAHVAIRASVGGSTGGGFSGGEPVIGDPVLLALVPRTFVLAGESLLSLNAAPMRSLAFETVRSLDSWEYAPAAALAFLLSIIVLRGRTPSFILVAGAGATLLPCVLVSRAIWMGFDRYLYMPLMLVLLAAGPLSAAIAEVISERLLPIVRFAIVLVLIALAASTNLASRPYRSHTAFYNAVIRARPRDVTARFSRVGCTLGDPRKDAIIRRELRSMPPFPWPKIALLQVVECASAAGALDVALPVAEEMTRLGHHDSVTRGFLMQGRYRQGRIDDALAIALSLRSDRRVCPEVRRQLQIWHDQDPDPIRHARLADTLASFRCPD